MHLNIQACAPTTTSYQNSEMMTFLHLNIQAWVLTTITEQYSGMMTLF